MKASPYMVVGKKVLRLAALGYSPLTHPEPDADLAGRGDRRSPRPFFLLVAPAKAGVSGQGIAAGLHETPAFGVPAKYYFAGCPCAGVTASR